MHKKKRKWMKSQLIWETGHVEKGWKNKTSGGQGRGGGEGLGERKLLGMVETRPKFGTRTKAGWVPKGF